MSWRTIVISETSKLDYQMGFMVVRGANTKRVYLNEIECLIIENTSVSFTAYLMAELVKNKVKVIFCDEKRNPSSELLPYYGSHDTSLKIKSQINWTADDKSAVWTEIVSEKIRKQAALLKEKNKDEYQLLLSYVKEISFRDFTNREGHAAKVYFNSLFGKEFTRTEDCPFNAALNYGYSLILSMFTRIVVANGYITQIGLFHDNMFNQFNLACDLMEPFRTIVDKMVYELKPEIFEKDQKHEMLKIFEKEFMIDGRSESISNTVRIYARSVFDALNEGDISLIKFYNYEL